jgi:hypothetical protein
MLVGDAAAPRIIRVMLEKVDGVWQGACTEFLSGNGLRNGTNRMVFSPSGKELYVGQTMREWAGTMEGLQRVVFHGGRVFDVKKMRLLSNGFELEFTEPVDSSDPANAAEAFETEVYSYRYLSEYGGPEHGLVKTKPDAVRWNSDRTKVVLNFSSIQPRTVFRVRLSKAIQSQGDALGHPMVAYTVNRLAK